MKMDQKYIGVITKRDGTPIPPEEWIVFRAKDAALPNTLLTYYQTCINLGADDVHLEGIRNLIDRVNKFQKDNSELVKTPDTTLEDMNNIL